MKDFTYVHGNKTEHQQRVEAFMLQAQQEIPNHPTMPDEKTRLLRAKLIFEEAVREAIWEGLAVDISHNDSVINNPKLKNGEPFPLEFSIAPDRQPNLVLIADGCADISVVTVGTLSACGIADKALLEEVDRSNLSKFKEPECPHHGQTMLHSKNGVYRCTILIQEASTTERCGHHDNGPYRDESGKWQKGPQYSPANIKAVLSDQMPKVVNPIELLKELTIILSRVPPMSAWQADNALRCTEIIEQLKQYHESCRTKRLGDALVNAVASIYSNQIQPKRVEEVQEIDTFDPTQEIRVGSVSDLANDPLGPIDVTTFYPYPKTFYPSTSGQVAPVSRSGDPSKGVLPPQKPMTLCGNCKTPLSDELVRRVRISPSIRALSQSQGLYQSVQYPCPECQKTLIASDLIQAT